MGCQFHDSVNSSRNQGIGELQNTIFQGKGYLKPIPGVSSGMIFSQVGNCDILIEYAVINFIRIRPISLNLSKENGF